MKRILSVMLAVCIVLGLSVGALAATVSIKADPITVKAGEDVTVTASLDEAFTAGGADFRLYFDSNLFTFKSFADAEDGPEFETSKLKTDNKTGASYYLFTFLTLKNTTVQPGDLCSFVFTAKTDLTAEQTAAFTPKFQAAADQTSQDVTVDVGPSVTVTVTPAAPASKYSVAASTTTASTTVGSDATVSLNVTNAATSNTYNSYYFELSYDNTVLEYASNNAGAEATAANGKLTIAGYGADRTAPVVLTFKGLEVGSSNVTITKANIDAAENAHVQNAPAAEIATPAVTINVTAASYNVTLDKTLFNGADTVTGGTDYTFSANDTEHYDYSNVTATMGGKDVTVIDKGDGTYTIKNVTGDLVISGTRTAKQYNVTVDGNAASKVTAASKATYNTDFTFTVDTSDNTKTYEVTIKVGGTTVTPTVNSTTYTIAGSAITGDIVITATQTDKPAETVNVKFEGNATADAKGEATAKKNTAYTFTVTKTVGYTYTLTAKNADGEITLSENNGTYTIAAKDVTKDITITVNKTANRTVAVSEYVKANNTQFWLVTVKGTVADGNVLTYNNAPMLWSAKYDAYAYLVIDTTGKTEAQMKTAAEAAIGEAAGEKTSISYGGDVNATSTVDVNDAQLVYNMYNAKYTSFDSCSMEKFLRADMNGDKTLTVNDAAAIVNIILNK